MAYTCAPNFKMLSFVCTIIYPLKLRCFFNSVNFKILQLIFVEIIHTIYLIPNFFFIIFHDNTKCAEKVYYYSYMYVIMTNFSILETARQKTTRAQYVYLTSAGTGVNVGILDVRYIAPWYLSVCQWLVLMIQ